MGALTVSRTNGQGAPAEAPEIKPWVWSNYTKPAARRRYAHILWTLALDGPFESEGGYAIKLLRDALKARGGPLDVDGVGSCVKALATASPYGGSVERTVTGRHCYSVALALPIEALPPNPFASPPAKPVPEPPPSKGQEPPPPSPLDPFDALTAIRGLVDEALGHGLTAAEFATAERLAGVLAEMEQLREERDQLQAALLERLTEVEALRRAFSARARKG
jgi:hypothetical protein